MSVTRKETYQDVVDLIKAGASIEDACFVHDVTIGSFKEYIRSIGVKILDLRERRKATPPVHKEGKLKGIYTPEDVQNMANDLKSWKLVARATGMPYCAIRTWASDNGVHIRKKKAN